MVVELAQSFRIQFRASRYITRLNWTSEKKVIVVCIWSELPFSIPSIPIHLGTQSNIRVKSYSGYHLLGASVLNFKRLDILQDSIGHLSQRLLWFQFTRNFRIQFRASRYITGLN